MTRARARQLNYQEKSFLAVQMSYSLNGVLLKPCDDVLMIRNTGGEQAHRMSDRNNHRVDAAMNKSKI